LKHSFMFDCKIIECVFYWSMQVLDYCEDDNNQFEFIWHGGKS
jgi:hypothetical protein